MNNTHERKQVTARLGTTARKPKTRKAQAAPRRTAIKIALTAAAILLLAVSGLSAYAVYGYDKIYSGVSCLGSDFSGLTMQQAETELRGDKAALEYPANVLTVRIADRTLEFSRENTGARYELDYSAGELAQMLYDIGRQGGFFTRLGWLLSHDDVDYNPESMAEFYIDRAAILSSVTTAAQELSAEPVPLGFHIGHDAVEFIRPQTGVAIDPDPIAEMIVQRMEQRDFRTLEYYMQEIVPDSVSLEVIYQNVYRAPQDAVVSQGEDGGYYIMPHVEGVDIDIDAVRRWLDTGTEPSFTALIQRTAPAVTQEALDADLFRDQLGACNTSLTGSNANRVNNVTLASSSIHGTILLPGDEFSFNSIVGQRTPERGYKEAGSYINGLLVDSVGGGICQVSSTLYNSVLLSNLKVTGRKNHSMTVSYLPTGLDAAVNWGTIDFTFVNNTGYPVRVDMWVENKTVYAAIYGTKINGHYVQMERKVLKYEEYETIEIVNESLAPGVRVTDSAGHPSTAVETYRVIYDEQGRELSRTFEAKSSYRKSNKIVHIGPAPVVIPPVTPPPSVTPPVTVAPPVTTAPEPTITPPASSPPPSEEPPPSVESETGTEPEEQTTEP